MKIIIFGCKGMLGRYVEKYFREKNYEVIPYSRAEFDIHNSFVNERLYTDLMNIITNEAMVINCAGITNKRPDISLSEMYIVNTIFPLILDRVCYDAGAVLFHISTDCVYTGKKGKYDSRFDGPDSTDSYGLSKQLGERICMGGCVIRTSIIGEEPSLVGDQDHPYGLLEWVRNNKEPVIKGYTNHFWNGVTCLELAYQLEKIIKKEDIDPDPGEIIQISSEKVNKYELVKMIIDVYELNIKVEPYETPNQIDKSLRGYIKVEKPLKQQIEEMRKYN